MPEEEAEVHTAVILEKAESVSVDSEDMPSDEPDAEDYSTMTVAELRTLAKSKGITGAGAMNRTQLIEKLSAN